MYETSNKGGELKEIVALVLTGVVILGSVGIVGCDIGEIGQKPTQTPTPEGEFTWDDMPIYIDANQIEKGDWSIPPMEGEWSRIEWHYYETGDLFETVTSFYGDRMYGQGWRTKKWVTLNEESWAIYTKPNDEKSAAMVWLASIDDKIVIALMRATK